MFKKWYFWAFVALGLFAIYAFAFGVNPLQISTKPDAAPATGGTPAPALTPSATATA